jgi:general secretion pathway protein D
MKCLRLVVAAILVLALDVPGYADEANVAYKRGVRAEAEKKYDAAFEAFRQAYALKPREPKYEMAFLRARGTASAQHVNNGLKLLEDQKLPEALAEFQHAAQIDGTNFVAVQEMQQTATLIKKQAEAANPAAPKPESSLAKLVTEAEGPPELEPSPNTPITLRMTTTADNVYRTIGKLGGINVLFDLDYKPQKITIELNEVMLREALRMVALESKTFWRPISPTAIFVASEAKRKEFEDNVLKTFYLRNASTSGELQEVAGTLKGMLDINRVQVNATHSSITVRGTPDQVVLAEKLVSDIDKPKAEVVIDIAVMEVSRGRINNLGTTVPTSMTVSPLTTTTGGLAGLVKLGSLNGTSYVTALPSATFTVLASDSRTKLLQKPQIRALDNEKATLKIGDRVPIATGSFASGIGGGGVSPLVNTQFQYIDVGVNIDITPHIHSDHQVTLKMVLEVSSVTGQQNIGGVTQPIIGQRRIEHETRLEDGEINLVGGILEDTETQSLSGYPWLMKIPLLKYLFGQDNREHTENEIVFAITPHIVRAEEITEENVKLIDIGSGNTIGLRYKEPKPTKTSNGVPGSGTTGSTSRARPSNGAQTRGQAAATPTPVAAVAPTPGSSPPAMAVSHPN